ncbi:MAG: glycosyltransferase [Pseudomonadota bacterium]
MTQSPEQTLTALGFAPQPAPARAFVRHRLAGYCGTLWASRPVGAPRVSVIIPSRDAWGKGFFPLLADQLFSQTIRDQCEFLVVLGDTRQGRAINAAADAAAGEFILTMDDDETLGGDHVIEALARVMDENPDVGMAGGMNVVPDDAPAFVRRVMEEIPRRLTPRVHRVTDSDLAEHGLLMMRREVFVELGGENEVLPRGLDPYLRREFRRAGWRVVVAPGASYSHLPPATPKALVKTFFSNGRQAAFCNRFYPQWVIDTGQAHGESNPGRVPLPLRLPRYAVRMALALTKGKSLLLLSQAAYAAGFAWAYLTLRQEDRP